MAVDGRAMVILGLSMLAFGGVNACIGYSLLGERGIEYRKRVLETFRKVREISAAQVDAAEQRKKAAAAPQAATKSE